MARGSHEGRRPLPEEMGLGFPGLAGLRMRPIASFSGDRLEILPLGQTGLRLES